MCSAGKRREESLTITCPARLAMSLGYVLAADNVKANGSGLFSSLVWRAINGLRMLYWHVRPLPIHIGWIGVGQPG